MTGCRTVSRATAWLLLAALLPAHEGGRKNLKPTKAGADLKLARQKMDAAKKKLAAQGRYTCCVRPSCNLCARVNGSCACAVNVAKGLGACGECYGGWQAGRGALKGVNKKSVKLLPAEKQGWGSGEAPPELKEATDALIRAKQTLVSEQRYYCCIRGGCDQCAHEADCPCGRDLATFVPEEYLKFALKPGSKTQSPSATAEATPDKTQEPLGRAPSPPGKDQAPPRKTQALPGKAQALPGKTQALPGKAQALPGKTQTGGVCGDCLDGWHAGHGAFAGIPLSDVQLAVMDSMDGSMGTASGWYASGTSQEPKSAPMEMLHKRLGAWNFMFHGVLFAVESQQTGDRGKDKFFSTNWFMPQASRRLGPGTLTLRTMFSLEPATITDQRYPLLFASGETANGGIPIINGQHPHDFFMELAASYQIPLGERASLNFYGGPRGEPALGPTAYPHRLSASEDPVAVISHHDQDSTHISNNVATVGLSYGPATIEASGFHGREPGEHRWGIEGGAIDSFAARFTLSPTSRWSGQFSVGRINKREATHPFRPSLRTTASITYVRPLARGHWATTLIWGRNDDLEYTQPPTPGLPVPVPVPLPVLTSAASAETGPVVDHIVRVPTRIPQQIYNSYLAESTLLFKNKNWIWGRVENVDKDSTLLYEESLFVTLVDENRFTRVQAYTAGYERELPRMASWLSTGLGGQFTYFGTPDNLKPIYGDHPVGVQVFLRFRVGPSAR